MDIPWILFTVTILIILLAVIFISLNKKYKNKGPDYYTFFIMGIIWLGAGIPLATTTNNWGFSIMGLIFMVLGLIHKKDWKKYPRTRWESLSKKEKQIKIWAIILLGIGILVLAVYVLFRANAF